MTTQLTTQLTATRPLNSSTFDQPELPTSPVLSAIFWLPIGLIGIAAIAAAIYAGVLRTWQQILSDPKRSQAMCERCPYFTDYCYWQCAIHPDKVRIKPAVDCPNFAPQSGQTAEAIATVASPDAGLDRPLP